MRRFYRVLLIVIGVSAAASPVRPIPAAQLVRKVPPAPSEPVPALGPSVPAHTERYTLERLQRSALSSTYYQQILRALTQTSTTASKDTDLIDQGDVNGSAGGQGDTGTEPSVATICCATNGLDLTVTAFNKSPLNGNPAIYYASTTDFTSFQRGQSSTSVYAYATDPWMEENPYAAGQGPQRMYCSGILYNNNTANPQDGASAVAVWHMDQQDNGTFSTTPSIVDTRPGG